MKLKIYSPYDQSVIKEISMHTENQVESALEKAYALFLNRDAWLMPYERKAILSKLMKLMEENLEDLVQTAASEGGKPYQDSLVEVKRAINGVEIAMEHIGQLKGEEISMNQNEASAHKMAFTRREPIGVVASVSAFNHPLNLAVHQIVTAFAAGCPVIFKPDLRTPLSGIALVDLMEKAGVPQGWAQVLICDNENAEKLVTDKRVNYFSFIGSHKVGWYLRSKLAPGTRCALEHGGAAPVIVEKDADMKELIPALTKGAFYHAGQVCVSVQRVFAEESIARGLAEKIAEKAKKLKVGSALDKETEVGPMILPREVDRMEEWVKEAKESGGEILCGGNRISDTCFAPTVIFNPSDEVKVSKEEAFGPILCIYPYKKRSEAIKKANALDMHFQAAVFTKNIDVAFECVQALNATAVMVNEHTAFRADWMPFGGRDASGIGMGGIPYSMHEMTREKLMVFKSKSL
ncbi:MAG: aldehyde dehydrogenase family protein [Cyclobacteriaceae bacterium]